VIVQLLCTYLIPLLAGPYFLSDKYLSRYGEAPQGGYGNLPENNTPVSPLDIHLIY
jgi:hypothetical protein